MTDPDETDMLAAEYVIGTLDAAERDEVASRIDGDPDLARAIRAWEQRLSPLVAGVPDVAPPAEAYRLIASRLFGEGGAAANRDGGVAALRRHLWMWQAATAGSALVAASLFAWTATRDTLGVAERPGFTAVLQRDPGAPTLVIDVDLAARRLTVRPLAGAAPAGHAYELWIIDPSLGVPRSLGLVPAARETRASLKGLDDAAITGATYAVTIEAPGGSPSGRPTNAPILSGRLSPSPS